MKLNQGTNVQVFMIKSELTKEACPKGCTTAKGNFGVFHVVLY